MKIFFRIGLFAIAVMLALRLAMFVLIDSPEELLAKAAQAYGQEDYTLLLYYLTKASDKGNVQAQYNIGVIYKDALGVEQDFGQAAYWFQLAADQDYGAAQKGLAILYRDGSGVPVDINRSIDLFEKAAEQGRIDSYALLGDLFASDLYANNDLVEQDYARAMQYFRQGDIAGSKQSTFAIGQLFDFGLGVPQSSPNAIIWFKKAAEMGHAGAQYRLGRKFRLGESVEVDFAQAFQWYDLATAQQDAAAWEDTGRMFYLGQGVPVDLDEARRRFVIAAHLGRGPANLFLGNMYSNGRGVRTNYSVALRFYRRAAVAGETMAQYRIGFFYRIGQGGVPQSDVKAYMWTSISAQFGQPLGIDASAQFRAVLSPEEIQQGDSLAETCVESGFIDCSWDIPN